MKAPNSPVIANSRRLVALRGTRILEAKGCKTDDVKIKLRTLFPSHARLPVLRRLCPHLNF